MKQTTQPSAFFPDRLDAAGLEVLLRSEVTRRSGAGQQDKGCDDSASVAQEALGSPGNQSAQQLALERSLEEAERQALAGAALTELSHLWAPLRPLARGLLYLTRTITAPQRRWNRIVLEVIRSLADSLRRLEAGVIEKRLAQPGPDQRYLDFENRFRGDRGLVKERLRAYLPLLRQAGIGTKDMPILDVGPGRGEWLELVREQGWLGWGMEGAGVPDGQGLEYLLSQPASSLGAVTAIHVLEHLPHEVMVRFLAETLRVLKPGGLAIFETPNPENVLVAACDFYMDATHQRPLHPEVLRFLTEQVGFTGVEVLRLREHRVRDPLPLLPDHHPLAGQLNPLLELANVRFFGAPDYAVVASKAA